MVVHEETFNLNERIGLVIYVHSLKSAKLLRKLASVYYVSKRQKYVFAYVDLSECDRVTEEISRFTWVREVTRSERPFIAETYAPKTTK